MTGKKIAARLLQLEPDPMERLATILIGVAHRKRREAAQRQLEQARERTLQ